MESLNSNKKPIFPLDKITRLSLTMASDNCENCGSTMYKTGFLGLFGEKLCCNNYCFNSKSKKNKKK